MTLPSLKWGDKIQKGEDIYEVLVRIANIVAIRRAGRDSCRESYSIYWQAIDKLEEDGWVMASCGNCGKTL
jgi:hypothetical protein